MNRLLATVASGTLLLGLGLAAPAVAQAAPSTPKVSNCGELSTKPTGIVLTCADAILALEKLEWTKWNSGTAKGTGVYAYNDCEPTCVAGTFYRDRVNVQLMTPKAVKGVKVFTKAKVTFPKGSGQSTLTFQLN